MLSNFVDAPIYQLFEDQVKRSPSSVAVVFENEQLTYRELNQRANQVAHYLGNLGVGPEVLVGICVERSLETIVGLLGILKAGAAYVPIDPAYPKERIAFMLEDSSVSVLLTQAKLQESLPQNINQVVRLDTDWEIIARESDENPVSRATADNRAYIIYTSGSTGKPKGVTIQHGSLVNYTEAASLEYALTARDRILQFSSISFDVSAEEIYACLTIGATLVLRSDSMLESVSKFLQKCQDWEITTLSLPTAYWHELTAKLITDNLALPPSLRLLIIGGEKANIARLTEWQQYVDSPVRLLNAYGPTEATISALICNLSEFVVESISSEVPIGKAIRNVQAYIVDNNLQLCPSGVVGELYLGGHCLARGYLNRPDLTAEKFIPNPFSDKPGERLYKTGDKVRSLADGNLEFIGRVDNQVKVRGFRIELGEIEAVLNSHPAVQESVVADREDISGQKRLIAYLVPKEENKPSDLPDLKNQNRPAGWDAEYISQSQTVYNEIYSETSENADPTFNIIGWNSSYTGSAIPAEEMRQWMNYTVERILSAKPKRVLEIGCGTGLLLFRIAPHCQQYVGVDFSQKVLRDLQQNLDNWGEKLPSVTLSQRTADNFEGIEADTFDTVIINSVSQHFPSIEYFLRVLEGAVKAVKPGGCIFVGDVRSLPLLEAFHASIQLYKANVELSREQLFQRVRSRRAQEPELVIDPAFFTALKQHIPKIGGVQIQLKRGSDRNELTKFRYDVFIQVGNNPSHNVDMQWLNWQEQQLSLPTLRQLLQATEPKSLGVRDIPNSRLVEEIKTLEWLANPNGTQSVFQWRSQTLPQLVGAGIDPEDIWALGDELPYSIHITWSKSKLNGCYDVVFQHRSSPASQSWAYVEDAPSVKPWSYYANQPLQGKLTQKLVPQIRSFLQEKLPDYMVPSAFMVLDALPLTPNGKIDRKALPAPDTERPELDENFVAPRTPVEEMLANIWLEVLGLERIGVRDNFFELGGHSLLGTQVISRIRSLFQVEVPLRSLFASPTIAGLASNLEKIRLEQQGLLSPPIQPIARDFAQGDVETTRQGRLRYASRDLPLSFAQQRLWFLDQLMPNNPFYNIPQAFRLTGKLNITALEQSINAIVQRHEILRTTFVAIDGKPVQVIAAAPCITLPVVDMRELPEGDRDSQAMQALSQSAREPFDLAVGPLFRSQLFQLGEEDYILLLTMHHIVSDGWSIGVLIQELALLYEIFAKGANESLPALPVQYADFAHWQRQWLQGEVLEKQLVYWKQQLAGAPAVLNLPSDRPRPQVQTFKGATQSFLLPKQLSEAIEALSKRLGATSFMTLLAAFQTLLYRYTNQPDIVIGSPIANRHWAEIEGLIGFFVNTLVLRTDLSGNPSFKELLNRVREVALGAYANQDMPFEQLVMALQPARDLSYTPLFQVMLALQNAPMSSLDLKDLTLNPLAVETRIARFDLFLSLENTERGLLGSWEYNTDLFDATAIARMAGNFQNLLEGIVSNPDGRLSELPLLNSAQQYQLLKEWNHTQVDYPVNAGIHELFEAQVEKTPDAAAVVFEGRQLTYQELNQKANQLAHYLRNLGVTPDALVGICAERSFELIVGLLGILKAGGAYLPLDRAYPKERLAFMIKDARVQVLLTQKPLVEFLPEHQAQVVCLDEDWETIAQQSQENPVKSVTPENLGYVIYTSGSTGKPKGVAMSRASLSNLLCWQMENSTVKCGAKTLQFSPVSFDVSFQEIFSTLGGGGTLVLISEEMRRDAVALLRFLQEQAIERLFLPFVALQQLAEVADSQEGVFTPLREIVTAGEQLQITRAIANWLSRQNGCILHNHYGPSESHVVTAFTLKDSPKNWPLLPPIGRPIANAQIYILDAYLKPVPIGVSGELYIGGAALARSYLNRPEVTAEKFIPNPFSKVESEESFKSGFPSERLYKTGDLARYLPDGNIEYLGRIDNQVKIRGFRIELGEIEAVLSQHPGLRESAIALREDVPGDKSLVAYVVPHVGALSPTVNDLRRFLKDKLPEYMVPSSFMILETLPLTPSGKVDRKALPAPDRSKLGLEAVFVAPGTPVEEVLAGIWAEILGLERVGVRDNFFELGGHSLLGTQIISRLRNIFKVELPLRSLFETPTVADLAKSVEAARLRSPKPQAPPIVPVLRNGNLPLSFPQQHMWLLAQLQSNIPYYNDPVILRLPGQINVTALQQALNEIVKRHETLRTTFASVDGQPIQVIQDASDLQLSVVDLQSLPAIAREAEALRLATEELLRPFDLTSDLLLRATLLQLSETDNRLCLTLHHIVYDGLSLYNVFFPELETLYKAFCAGMPSPLADLPIQYADFAVWQRQWLQPAVLEPHLAYWKQQLADLPILQLSTDRPRPAFGTFEGAREEVAISKTLTDGLKAMARREGVTLFMTLQAAFKTLLFRYTDQEDIPVGIVTAGRDARELEGVIGFFVNFLVLRTDMKGNPSFRELLKRVREVTLDAHAHQDVPFEKLVQELRLERRLGQNPLYQVMLLLDPPMPTLQSGWTMNQTDLYNGAARCDITLGLEDKPEGLTGHLVYSTELFDAGTIRRMLQHFQTVLEAIVANPEQKISELPLLNAPERQWLVSRNNNRNYRKEACLHQLFEAQVEKMPSSIAVVYAEEQLTYQELNEKANQLAHYLRRLLAEAKPSIGVGSEVLVGLCVERSIEMVVGILGILKAGCAYVPLDPSYPSERLAFTLDDSCCSVLVTKTQQLEKLPPHQSHVVCLDADCQIIAQQSQENPVSAIIPDNLAYVIYTSGSTGKPKGVLVNHSNVVRLFEATNEWYGFNDRDVWTLFHSYAFDFSVWELWGALLYGGRVVVVPHCVSRSPDLFYDLLHSEGVTVLNQTPGAFRQLIQIEESACTTKALNLRLVIFGGEALEVQSLKPWFERHGDSCPQLVNMYGITETTVHVTYRPLTIADLNSNGSNIGIPIPDLQVYILDRYLQPLPIGVPGEMYVGGAGVSRGYLNRPELNAERFIVDPFSDSEGARLYKTGDRARYLPSGEIEYLGRIDSQVKIRGFRIELGEIEGILSQHPDVREAVVVANDDEQSNKRLVAYIVSNLTPDRVPFKTSVSVEMEGKTIEAIAEDISLGGIGLVGLPEMDFIGLSVRLRLQLPGNSEELWLSGNVAWQQGQRIGIQWAIAPSDRAVVRQSVEYLLETQGFLKVLQRTTAANLRPFLKQKLPDYMVPDRLVMLGAMPLTSNGKVDRRALPVPDSARPDLEESFVAPRTPVEEVLAGIWTEVLRLERVGVRDNFFELGGHSLIATQIVYRVRNVFQVELPLRSLFESPTIASQAQIVENFRRNLETLPGTSVLQAPPILPISRDTHLPLSFTQQRLWFLYQLNPDTPFYNEPATIQMSGEINLAALEQSLNEIIRRHEVLRTTFTLVDGQPVQVIHPAKTFNLPVVNLEKLPAQEREAQAKRLATEEARLPFDLKVGPLMRATLMNLGEEDYRLFLTFHHIVIDGSSANVFVPELASLYAAFSAGIPSPLPELAIQYADFAVWERQWLQGEVLAAQLSYWKQQLADLPMLQLPIDRPREAKLSARLESPLQSFQGARQSFVFSKALTEKLKTLSRREGATLFMTLLAAFKILLCRYAGQDDIVVGTVTAGRNRAEIQELIGCFGNTLVMRSDLSGNPSFLNLLKRVREVALGAYAHQDLPFDKLVEELQPERNLGQHPLFQVAFVIEPPILDHDSMWNASQLDIDTGTAKFDLTFELNESSKGLFGQFEYKTDLFDAATIARMIGNFQILLEGIVANPEQKISELPILTTTERQQLLSWNETFADYPSDACIHQLFEAQVEKTPDAVAVVFERDRLTYRELNGRANQLARYLRSLGVKPEVLVGICVERSLEMVVGILGILKAGGVYIPLDPSYPPERLAFMLEDSSVSLLLTKESCLSSFPKHKARAICLDKDRKEIAQQKQDNLISSVIPENLAYIIYTSGSTGRPKGVQVLHRGLCNLAQAQINLFKIQQNSRILQFASISFDASVWEVVLALVSGATLCLEMRDSLLPGDAFIRLLRDKAITTVTLPSSMLAILTPDELPDLQTLIVAGEACSAEIVARWAPGRRFFNAYGPTETTVCATVAECTDANKNPPIGQAIANTQVYLLDSHRQLVPIGVPGELYIGGAGLARGYLNRPDLTAEKFIPNPFSKAPGSRLYKTGDLARYLPDGNIEFLGRIDNQVKLRGFRIELGEIESLLRQHPNVREAVVLQRENAVSKRLGAPAYSDRRLVAYIVSTLIPDRVTYQSACLMEIGDRKIVELTTENISIGGVGLVGMPTDIGCEGQRVRLRLLLPPASDEQWLEGRVVWRKDRQIGVQFTLSATEQTLVRQSVEYLLESQGFLKVLQRTLAGQLRSFLKEKLPDYMMPSAFVTLGALPLTPNGKVDRRALPAPEGLRSDLESSYLAPQNELERNIAIVWQEILQVEKVGINDNFFDLGGHSLLVVRVHSKLQEIGQQNISMLELFKYPTISSLAKYLTQEQNPSISSMPSHEGTADKLRQRAHKQKEAINRQKQLRKEKGKNNG